MRAIIKHMLLGAIGATVLSVSAQAADMIEPLAPAPEYVPVEVGSGWYLRGDVSYDFKSKYSGSFRTFDGTNTDSKQFHDWEVKDGIDYGVGAGYQFTDYFRGDLTAHYWKHDVNGHDKDSSCGIVADCGSSESSSARAWELMANAYVDVGTFAGFTPYVGGGIGGVNLKYSDFASKTVSNTGVTTIDTLNGTSDWRFAYALMAGVSYDLTRALKIDVGYRYVNVDTGPAFGKSTLGSVVEGTDKGFGRQTVQVGLRYSLF